MSDESTVRCKITHLGQTLGMGVTEADSESVARNASVMKAVSEVDEWDSGNQYNINCSTK